MNLGDRHSLPSNHRFKLPQRNGLLNNFYSPQKWINFNFSPQIEYNDIYCRRNFDWKRSSFTGFTSHSATGKIWAVIICAPLKINNFLRSVGVAFTVDVRAPSFDTAAAVVIYIFLFCVFNSIVGKLFTRWLTVFYDLVTKLYRYDVHTNRT